MSAPAGAQTATPYILAEIGGSMGDGGAAPAAAVGFGYLTARRIGFEIEVAYVPDLEFGDPGIPRIAIFPPLEIESTGRAISFQTNVVAVLPGSGRKLRGFVLAGGGVVDVKQRISVLSPIFDPAFLGDLGSLGLFPPPLTFRNVTTEVSDTDLMLGAGTGIDYEISRRFAVGASVRYQHVFSEPRSLDMARVATRVTWRF